MSFLVELLAPVGSREALTAAVESGANAVYFGGQMFGARASANNFDETSMKEAIEFAHMRNVLVNVTVNTLVDNRELDQLSDYLRFLYEVGADALLVQDFGVAKLAHEIVPNLPLHASTQMTVHNLEGVLALEKIGFTRVVLSRELSLKDIEYICQNSHVEIEVFVHGALCVCYSGQCLMSSMIGGRSGNRGRCAQPCRLPYTLVNQEDEDMLKEADAGQYLLSPRDLKTIDALPQLIEAGVASLKIEGRMKRPEYVATVVDTYRRAIDSYIAFGGESYKIDEKDHKDLSQIFNRDFTTDYLLGRPNRQMMSDRRPNNRGALAGRVVQYDMKHKLVTVKLSEEVCLNDIVDFWVKVGGRVSATITQMWVGKKEVDKAAANEAITFSLDVPVKEHDRVFKVFDANLMEKARLFFNTGAPVRRIGLKVAVTAQIGLPLRIEVEDEDGYRGWGETEFIAEAARKRPLTDESIKKQIDRLGTSIYALHDFGAQIKGDVMVPVSEINEARRKAVEMAMQSRLVKFERKDLPEKENVRKKYFNRTNRPNKAKPDLAVSVDTIAKVQAALENGADWIVFGGESYNHANISAKMYQEAHDLVRKAGKKISFNTPRILRQPYVPAFKKLLASFSSCVPDEIHVHNIATLALVKECCTAPIRADFSMNVYNNLAIDFLKDFGVSSVTLSPELNMSQVETVAQYSILPLECIVHGNLELMVSAYCAMGSFLGNLENGPCTQPCQKQKYWLKDRKNENFPLVTDQFCNMHLLNGKELSMLPHIIKFGPMGIKRVRIEGKYMDLNRLKKMTKLYQELLSWGEDHPMMKNDQLEKIEDGQITRGHYFRGVL